MEFTSVNIGFETSCKLSISRCGCVLAVSVTCVFTACSCDISVLMKKIPNLSTRLFFVYT